MTIRSSRRAFIASAAVSMLAPLLAGAKRKTERLLSLFADQSQVPAAAKETWSEAGVIDLSHSPFAKLHTVPVRAVTIQEGFWSKRQKTNIESSMPSMHSELLEHGRMDNSSSQHSYYYANGSGAAFAGDVGADFRVSRHLALRGQGGFIFSQFSTPPTKTDNTRWRAGTYLVYRF